MSQNIRRISGVVSTLLFSAVALGACGTGEETNSVAADGSLASSVDLSGVNIAVGSKEYPEQEILGQILVQTLRAAGATVTDKTKLAGTNVTRAALETGEIDVYYEYTGTAWLTIFGETRAINDPQELFETVRRVDKKNDISWFALAPFNNTYALGAPAEVAERHGVNSISDYAKLVRTNPDEATLCASAEFRTRDDGLPGLEERYEFTQSQETVFNVEQTVIYAAVEQNKCNFLYLTSTDARIQEKGIVVLEDDKSFFPVYNPAVTMRSEVYTANEEQYDKLFGQISELLTQEVILELNGAVEVKGLPADKVAEKFLEEHEIV